MAVIREVPTPTMVTVEPTTLATSAFELVYVNAPVLLEVGATSSNGASPGTFEGIEKLDKTVVIKLTWNGAIIVAET
jgi:hypothetical protein